MKNRLENNPVYETDGTHEVTDGSNLDPQSLGRVAELSVETSAPSKEVISGLAKSAFTAETPEPVEPSAETSETPEAPDPLETLNPHEAELVRTYFGPNFNYAAFVELYGSAELVRDARYIRRCQKHFDKPNTLEDVKIERQSKNFEKVLLIGIVNGWLGNTKDHKTGQRPFEVNAFSTTNYDDYRNRIDCGVSIVLPDDDIEGTNLPKKLNFGVDFTTSRNRDNLYEKLYRNTNDESLSLPEGYSRLKYFDDHEEQGDRILPRFTIALDAFEDPRTVLTSSSNSDVRLGIRFKMLDQLTRQAKLRAAKAHAKLDYFDQHPELISSEQPSGPTSSTSSEPISPNSPEQPSSSLQFTPDAAVPFDQSYAFLEQQADIFDELASRFQDSLERTTLVLTTMVTTDEAGKKRRETRPNLLGRRTASLYRAEIAGTINHRDAAERRVEAVREAFSSKDLIINDIAYAQFNRVLANEEASFARIQELRAV